MKKLIVCLVLTAGIGIGFLLPSFAVARTFEVGVYCYNDEIQGGSNDGYYKCTATSCDWIELKRHWGPRSGCGVTF